VNANADDASRPPRPGRRPRYSGSHPRKFAERYKEHAASAHPEHTAHLRDKGRVPVGTHAPVLLREVLELLDPRPGQTIVDCTLGFGGHARTLLEKIAPGGRLIGLDQDARELEKTRARLAEFGDALHLHAVRFAAIGKVLAAEGLAQVDGLLADLGVSSMQLDDPARGFSLKHDGPLDLRMDERRPTSGAALLREIPEDELAALLRDLADEPDAAAIAAEIVAARAVRPLERTHQLVEVVLRAKGTSRREVRDEAAHAGRTLHPAARTFQALRMKVNDEPGQLHELLRVAPYVLKPGGRIAVISFHSGEDRQVKDAFRRGLADALYEEATAEPVRASPEERRFNSRAASAKLRGATRAAGRD
jgi:16S rRNA (cytosine1402-N4)-methyltransferase